MTDSQRTPVISVAHARGLRNQSARDASAELVPVMEDARRGKLPNSLRFLHKHNRFAGQRRRPPAPGKPGGLDVIEMNWHREWAVLRLMMLPLDKHGFIVAKLPDRLLLQLTKHATDSLFQRLRTIDSAVVEAELRPVGNWLLKNLIEIGMTSDGYLLTPSGVLPVKHGPTWAGRDPDTDASCFWEATTWISDHGLEDHTVFKKRLADAVRKARGCGTRVGLLQPMESNAT